MPAPLLLIETTETLPPAADVVVIGGGIVGVFTAYYLARRGVKVALVEKGRIGAEQSSRNWGWCRQQNRDARELPMATASLDLWERLAARDRRETPASAAAGCSTSRTTRPRSPAGPAGGTSPGPRASSPTCSTAAEATERGRATGKPWKGGVFSPTDGTADPANAPRRPSPAALMQLGGTRAPVLRRARHRARGRPGRRRRHRNRHDPHPHRGARGRGLGLLLLPPARHPLSPGRGALLDPRGRPRRGSDPDALHTARRLAHPPRRTAAIPSPSAAARGSTRRRSRCASPAVPADVRPSAGAVLAPGGLAGMRAGHETCARWRARPADADGAHAHPRSPARRRDDPRNPRPCASSCFPASQTFRIAADMGGLHRQHARTGCPAIGEIRDPGPHPRRGLQRPRLRHRPRRRPPDRRHGDRRAPAPRPRPLTLPPALTEAPGAKSRTSDTPGAFY